MPVVATRAPSAEPPDTSSLRACLALTAALWAVVVLAWYLRFTVWFFEPLVVAFKYLLVLPAVAVTVPTLLLARQIGRAHV